MKPIHVDARWREEAVATSEAGTLIFEFTMGKEHLYFPDEARWLAAAPAWAKDLRPPFLEACERWCKDHRYPISIVADAQFYEER